MTAENSAECPLHSDLVKYVDAINARVNKMYDRLFIILVLVAVNLFFSGVNVTKGLFQAALAIAKGG